MQAKKGIKMAKIYFPQYARRRDMLLSQGKRKDAEKLTDLIQHTKPNEIEGIEFQYIVAERMYFK